MKHLLKTAFVAVAFVLPQAAAAQDRYPELKLEQLTPAQKAYVESLQKPPRNNTTALRNPPFRVYMCALCFCQSSRFSLCSAGMTPRLPQCRSRDQSVT